MMGGLGGMMGGMGGMGGMMGGMGGFDPMGMGMGMGPAADAAPLPPFFHQFDETCERIAMGLIGARVRTRTLIELLEEKGIFGPGQFDERATQVWERDYDALAEEITAPLRQEPEAEAPAAEGGPPATEAEAEAPRGPSAEAYYGEALMGFVDDSVAGRVRLRAVLELLEEKGIFAPGEFDKKADQIWERDYEELVLEFHKGSY